MGIQWEISSLVIFGPSLWGWSDSKGKINIRVSCEGVLGAKWGGSLRSFFISNSLLAMAFLSPLHLLLLWGRGSRCLPSCVGKKQPQGYQAVYSVPSHWSLGFNPNLILTSDSIIGILQSEFQIWYLLLGTLPVCSLTSLDTESAHRHMCSITAPHTQTLSCHLQQMQQKIQVTFDYNNGVHVYTALLCPEIWKTINGRQAMGLLVLWIHSLCPWSPVASPNQGLPAGNNLL